jgi:hypothetical protein
MDATQEKENVQRIVRGGATMSPVYDGPVPKESVLPYAVEFLKCSLRGPILAVLVTKLAYPSCVAPCLCARACSYAPAAH